MPLPASHWQPYALPVHAPLPLQQPTKLALTEPVLLDDDVAAFLALGLGPLWEHRWSWHWAADGVLHLFENDVELLRARLRPVALLPGAAWQVTALLHEPRTTADDAQALLQDALDQAAALRAELLGNPHRPGARGGRGDPALPRLPASSRRHREVIGASAPPDRHGPSPR